MDELKEQIKRLNDILERFVNFYTGTISDDVFSSAKAFKATVLNHRLLIRPLKRTDPVKLSHLKGIDHVISEAKKNLLNFLNGLPYQNVLIYGPRGTGKSSVVKALFNEYSDRGLKIIEMNRDALLHLDELIEAVILRPERFIFFCDDLSFQATERDFIALKTLLEGGLEIRPDNVIIYATSNRRHIVRETRKDNLPEQDNEDLHPSDSIEEKVSLSERFGIRLYTGYFSQDVYLDIVKNYLSMKEIEFSEITRLAAIRWAREHGGFTGRVARQFVDYWEAGLKSSGLFK